MLKNSIIGTLYGFWLYSAIFDLLRAIYRPFARAWRNSAIIHFIARPPKVEVYYRNSIIGRIIDGIWRFFLRIFTKIMDALRAPARSSFFVRIASGSHVCSLEFLMCAFVFVMFCAPHAMWSNSYALLGAVGLFGLYFLMAAAGARRAVSPLELGFPFLLFVLACFLSLGFTSDRGDSIRVLFFFIAAFLITYVYMANLTDESRLDRLMGWMYFAVLVTALYAVVQRFMGVEVSASYTDLSLNVGVPGRVYSTLDNPNNYAEFLVLFTPLCTAWAMQRKNPTWRFLTCCSIALPLLALVMTYSRGGWLSIAVSALVFVYYYDKRLIPPAIVVCLLAIPFLPDSVMTRISTIFNSHDSSASHRLITWRGILNMIGDYGITGIGMGPNTFAALYPDYALAGATKGVYHTQMLYLELFVEWGVVGFIGFMWLMLRHVKDTCFAIARRHSGALHLALIATCSAFCGIAILSIFEYIWFYPRILFAFAIVLGIGMACLRMSVNDAGKEECNAC